VEALRGLEATEEFAVRVLDEAELIEHLTDSFHRDNPPELVESSDGLLKIMGLLAESQSLEDLYLELLGGSVLGFYDDDEGALYVVSRDEAIGALERFTLSHEIDHALQDQTWVIDEVVPDAANEGDAALAGLSLIEGDASVLMTQWAAGNLSTGCRRSWRRASPSPMTMGSGSCSGSSGAGAGTRWTSCTRTRRPRPSRSSTRRRMPPTPSRST
jgi:hypothetical protein